MDHLIRRLVHHAAKRATGDQSLPGMQPLPTPSIPSLAAAAAGQPPAEDPTGLSSAGGGSQGGGGDSWDQSLNSTFAENFTMITDGLRDQSPTFGSHVTVDEAWPVYPFTVIKVLVLSVILAILLIVTYKVTMQYVIKTWKREKR